MNLFYRIYLWLAKPAALVAWLGNGAKPVSRQTAIIRSWTCLGCPLNRKGHLIIEGAALIIKNRLGLVVPEEHRLNTCHACSCFLPLKIWVPYQHIRQWTSQETIDRIKEIKPDCWQL